jgi:hypothetical protein
VAAPFWGETIAGHGNSIAAEGEGGEMTRDADYSSTQLQQAVQHIQYTVCISLESTSKAMDFLILFCVPAISRANN